MCTQCNNAISLIKSILAQCTESKESIKIPLDFKWNFPHNSFFTLTPLHLNIVNITSRKFLHFIAH